MTSKAANIISTSDHGLLPFRQLGNHTTAWLLTNISVQNYRICLQYIDGKVKIIFKEMHFEVKIVTKL